MSDDHNHNKESKAEEADKKYRGGGEVNFYILVFILLYNFWKISLHSREKGKKRRDGEKGKELRCKTCDWHLTFILFIQKSGMKQKNLPQYLRCSSTLCIWAHF